MAGTARAQGSGVSASGPVAVRWRRYGHDRLYVAPPEGCRGGRGSSSALWSVPSWSLVVSTLVEQRVAARGWAMLRVKPPAAALAVGWVVTA